MNHNWLKFSHPIRHCIKSSPCRELAASPPNMNSHGKFHFLRDHCYNSWKLEKTRCHLIISLIYHVNFIMLPSIQGIYEPLCHPKQGGFCLRLYLCGGCSRWTDSNQHQYPQPLLYWFSVRNLSLTHCHWTCLKLQRHGRTLDRSVARVAWPLLVPIQISFAITL